MVRQGEWNRGSGIGIRRIGVRRKRVRRKRVRRKG